MAGHKPGPGVDLERLELALNLRLRGLSWMDIRRATKIPLSTMMEWRKRPEWEELRAKLASRRADVLAHLAHEVLKRRLLRELGRKIPDVDLAWRIAERVDLPAPAAPGGFDGPGATARTQVVILPAMDTGVRSRPATEVLLPAPASAATPPPEPPKKGGKRKVVALPEVGS